MELWHNPRCSKSRAAKQLLDERGVDYVERRYLDDVPTVDQLNAVLTALGRDPWEIARLAEPIARELGMADWPREGPDARGRWIAALVEHPILIERPIVIADDGRAALGRPTEAITALIDATAAR